MCGYDSVTFVPCLDLRPLLILLMQSYLEDLETRDRPISTMV